MRESLERLAFIGALFVGALTLTPGCAEEKGNFIDISVNIAEKERKYENMPADYERDTIVNNYDTQIDKRIKQLQKNMQQSRKKIAMANEIIKYLNEEGEEALDFNITELDDEGIENLYNLYQEKKEKEERESWNKIKKAIQKIMLQ